jgi:Domain of unknown function (DUF1992)
LTNKLPRASVVVRKAANCKPQRRGKRTTYVDGYQETPEEYRMAFKALKDSGYVPAEVEMMKTLTDMRARLSTIDPSSSEALTLKREIVDLQLKVSVRLESIARGG